MNKKAQIYDELILLATAFGQKSDTDRIKIYTEILNDYELADVSKAIKACIVKCKFFPQAAEIIECIKSPTGATEEQAVMIANKVFEAIGQYGAHQFGEARSFLGNEIWGIVERFGRWSDLCRIENSEVTTTKAQLRELAKAYLNRSKREYHGGDFHINSTPITFENTGLQKLEVFDV